MAPLQVVKGDFLGHPPREGANQPTPKEDREFSEDLKQAEPGLCPEELLFSEGNILTLPQRTHRYAPANPRDYKMRNKVRGVV